MDRYWLLTWRTYGTWLPGEPGFVSEFRDANGRKALLNTPGEPCADPSPALAAYAAAIMTEDAVLLDLDQADAVANQLRETARYRRWQLLGLAVIPNHVHVMVGVPGDPDPERLLADFKAWCTRRLNNGWGIAAAGGNSPALVAKRIRRMPSVQPSSTFVTSPTHWSYGSIHEWLPA